MPSQIPEFRFRAVVVLLFLAAFALPDSASAQAPDARPAFVAEQTPDAVIVKSPAGRELLRYQLIRPEGNGLSVESACYFHPLATPAGVTLTEVAPDDHRHHRGIFLAWVEMHGEEDADFWGWGEHAPKDNRIIRNRGISDLRAAPDGVSFRASNEWLAAGRRMIAEKLDVQVRTNASATVVDLAYHLTPDADVKLSRWAFSGFCVRTRKDGELRATSPAGQVTLENPKHTEPLSDWPAAAWYDYTLTLPDGRVAGVAVIDHPLNPPALWHNHRDVRMLNPCIVAPGEVVLKAGEPRVLRYRVVAHDGPVPVESLNTLAREFSESSARSADRSSPGKDWVPLFDGRSLEGWTVTEFGGRGDVSVKDGAIRLEAGAMLTGVHRTNDLPRTDYEVQIEAMKVEGSDFFCGLTVPVGESHCTLIVGGWGGGVLGISSIDGQDASENETTRYIQFKRNRWYHIRLRITRASIQAWLDDEKMVDQPIEGRRISLRPGDIEYSAPFGIAAWQTTAAIRNVRLRRLAPSEIR